MYFFCYDFLVFGSEIFLFSKTRCIVFDLGLYCTDQARVVLYKGGNSVKQLKFNAERSDNVNWFQFDKLTENPWRDMATQPRNLFTIEAALTRSFIINSEYGNHCQGDFGWMVITGTYLYCDWERHYGQNAVIYSKGTGRTNWRDYSKYNDAEEIPPHCLTTKKGSAA